MTCITACAITAVMLTKAFASPMGDSYRSRTLSPHEYLDHIEDHPIFFDVNQGTAALSLDGAPDPYHNHQQSYHGHAQDATWYGQSDQQIQRHYPQEHVATFVPHHVAPLTRSQQDHPQSFGQGQIEQQQHVWHEQRDAYGNRQIFDDEGNLYQLDEFGNYYMVDNDGILYPVQQAMSEEPMGHVNQYSAEYSPLPNTAASPAMSEIVHDDHRSPIFKTSHHRVIPQQYQLPHGTLQYEEGSGENDVYRTDPHPDYYEVKQAYDQEGLQKIYNAYYDCVKDIINMTWERASLDLKQGLTLPLAKQLCSGEAGKISSAADRVYYLAGMFRSRGHH